MPFGSAKAFAVSYYHHLDAARIVAPDPPARFAAVTALPPLQLVRAFSLMGQVRHEVTHKHILIDLRVWLLAAAQGSPCRS